MAGEQRLGGSARIWSPFPQAFRPRQRRHTCNWGVFEWLITFVEVGAGALLILGLATRGAALVGLGQQLFLPVVYLSQQVVGWPF